MEIAENRRRRRDIASWPARWSCVYMKCRLVSFHFFLVVSTHKINKSNLESVFLLFFLHPFRLMEILAPFVRYMAKLKMHINLSIAKKKVFEWIEVETLSSK